MLVTSKSPHFLFDHLLRGKFRVPSVSPCTVLVASANILEVLENDERLVPTFSLGEQKSPITKGWGVCFDSKLYLTNPLAYTVLKMGLHNLDHISQHRPTIRLVNDT